MEEHFFSTSQIAEKLDMPLRKIIAYTERGYVEASILAPSGYGSRRLWSMNDLKKIEIIRKCESFGLSPKFLRKLCNLLDGEDLLSGSDLIIDGHGLAFNSHGKLSEVLSDTQRSPYLCIVQYSENP